LILLLIGTLLRVLEQVVAALNVPLWQRGAVVIGFESGYMPNLENNTLALEEELSPSARQSDGRGFRGHTAKRLDGWTTLPIFRTNRFRGLGRYVC